MFRRYRQWQVGEFVVVAGDTSAGGLDYSAAQFISKQKADVPLVYHSKKLATEMTPLLHQELESIYDITAIKPVIALERNNGGVFEMERLATLNRNGKYTLYTMPAYGQGFNNPESTKLGFDTNSATRPAMLTSLKEAVDKRVITLYDIRTIEEMFAFIIVQTSTAWKAQAESGAHDDLVMSLAIAWQLFLSAKVESQAINEQARAIVSERLQEDFS